MRRRARADRDREPDAARSAGCRQRSGRSFPRRWCSKRRSRRTPRCSPKCRRPRWCVARAVREAGAGCRVATVCRKPCRADGLSEVGDARAAGAEAAADAGAAPRAARQGLRQGREVPGAGGLFRGAQRAGARPAGGGAGRAQPRVLAVLSEGRLLGGVPERAPASVAASSPSPATASRKRSTSAAPGRAPTASPSRRSTPRSGCPR